MSAPNFGSVADGGQVGDRVFALDSANRHQWWPMAPRARIEVDIDSLSVHWRGGGYLDQNFGSEPESVFGEAAKDLLEQGPKTPWRDLVAGLAS